MPATITLSVKAQRPPIQKSDALDSAACALKASTVIKISIPPDESDGLIMKLVHLCISFTFCVHSMRVI